ncbi:WxL domain-containing protein [Loigolactobacillus backii]|uniref:Uncharacterized protein n=1 Tax=Loigolactobacillus backii TaxID=375175 RepID=A0A192H3U2_9LACO|nr:WxL domain-containing protein [Loigolactobacillus backii]ANK62887.1 hypothetical protein AYR53_09020 [Loigolactobacillus backii]ANK70105.1 hypothetical protein AYR56_07985 [Loigolactobacillus backii]MDA5387233.1 WxL domain-containing protein [Loigolactobacillus backii]MDA5389770.1 WxL domain-containing protein [Loigolactobacillus backii]PIO83460.1 hypothetical protein BSQ39_07755 [Loigolactobacillus backii]
MKKLSLLTLAAAGGLLISGGISGTALAASTSTANTDATASFTDNTDPTNPVDPEDPDIDNPGGGGETENPGPLSLDYASNLDFGTNAVPKTNTTYIAKDDHNKDGSTTFANYAQVTDQRSGAVKGWSLTVSEDAQFKAAKSGTELTGAELSLGKGTTKTTSDNSATGGTVTSSEAKLSTDGATTQVMNATTGNGFGTWVDSFGQKGGSTVKLMVPAAAHPEADAYNTTLTWNLEDTPANA